MTYMKRESCKGPECIREQLPRFDLCKTHRRQVTNGKPLTPLRVLPGEQCTFDGCDRPGTYFRLCPAHRRQEKAGKALSPLEVPGVVQPDCSFEGCDRTQMVRFDLCKTHRLHQRSGLPLLPLGQRRKPKTVKPPAPPKPKKKTKKEIKAEASRIWNDILALIEHNNRKEGHR